MNKRVVIVGANGMLGGLCAAHFGAQKGCEVIALGRQQMDLEKDSSIRRALEAIEFFDVVINCAAWTDVDGCEDDPKKANQINGYAVGMIGQVSADQGAQVIHISTDYVFDGGQETPYSEEDEPNPISIYGESKLTGEEELFDSFPDHLVLRVSWLFGPGKAGFPEWVVRQAMQKSSVQIVSDKWGSPSYAPDVIQYLDSFVFSEEPYGGLLHLCNAGQASWLEWGQHCLDQASAAGLPLKTTSLDSISMKELAKKAKWKAKRPVHSSLDPARIATATGETPRAWQDAVSEFVETDLVPRLQAE